MIKRRAGKKKITITLVADAPHDALSKNGARLKFYDPDYRRIARVNPCEVCGREIKKQPAQHWIHMAANEFGIAVHPADYRKHATEDFVAIGPECARKLKGWTHTLQGVQQKMKKG